MTALFLTPAERKAHRADAHHLNPVVMIGNDGLTPAVVKEADLALNAHGLIKIRVLSDDRQAREDFLAALCDTLNAAPVQHIGKLLVLWRPRPAETDPTQASSKGSPRIVKVVKPTKTGNHRPTIKKVRLLGNQRVAAGGQIKRARARVTSIKKRVSD